MAKYDENQYVDEPRETVVSAEGEPPVTYEIAADGSILKWHFAADPPVINEPKGTLWDQRVGKAPNSSARGKFKSEHGDSGGPVWNIRTGSIVGEISAGFADGKTGFTPLYRPPGYGEFEVPGIFHAKGMGEKQSDYGNFSLETVE